MRSGDCNSTKASFRRSKPPPWQGSESAKVIEVRAGRLARDSMNPAPLLSRYDEDDITVLSLLRSEPGNIVTRRALAIQVMTTFMEFPQEKRKASMLFELARETLEPALKQELGPVIQIADEIRTLFKQLGDDEEREIATTLFKLALGVDEPVPEGYGEALMQIQEATASEVHSGVKGNGQRPLLIAELSRNIKQGNRYKAELYKLNHGVLDMDTDLSTAARLTLNILSGMSIESQIEHNADPFATAQTGAGCGIEEVIELVGRIPRTRIESLGPADAILEVYSLWQELRRVGADEELALEGVSVFGTTFDSEISATNAYGLYDRLRIEGKNVYDAVIRAAREVMSFKVSETG